MGLRSLVGRGVRAALSTQGYDVVSKNSVATLPATPDGGQEHLSDGLFSPHYSPWVASGDPVYSAIFEKADAVANWAGGRREVVPQMRERMYVLHCAALNALRLPGEFVECGVYRGGSATICAETVRGKVDGRHFYLFDTFEGTPDKDLDPSETGFEHRRADTSVETVGEHLSQYGDFPVIVPGYVPDTFEGLPDFRVAYLHIDINTAAATYASAAFFYDRMSPGAVAVFDDYGWEAYGALRQRVDEFAAERGARVLPLRCGTGLLIKA